MSYKEKLALVQEVENDIDCLIREGCKSESEHGYSTVSIMNEDSHLRYSIRRGDISVELQIFGRHCDYEIIKYFLVPFLTDRLTRTLLRIHKKLKRRHTDSCEAREVERIHSIRDQMLTPRNKEEETKCFEKR